MKKRWLSISLLVGGLMVAITGGMVLAQTPDAEQEQTKQSKAGRLAEILGGAVTEESVQDASHTWSFNHNRLVELAKAKHRTQKDL